MKAISKTLGRLTAGCALASCLVCLTPPALAIENLQVTVPATNAVLAWPSDPSETYLIQYRSTLSATDAWTTLTDYFPADSSSNITFFTDPNPLQYGFVTGGGTNGGGASVINSPTAGSLTNSVNPTNGAVVTPGTGFYRVVRDGVHLWDITNGMVLHNELITPIEFAVGSTDQIVGVTFYDDTDSPIIGASAKPSGANGWQLDWNTTLSFNGNYNIYAKLDFASDASVVSQPVSVTVNNTISFPNYFSRVYGDQMWIYAQTIPNAAYEIDLYDENTNYLGSFDDYADGGGTISFIWELTDGNGNTFDSTNFSGVFTVTLPSSNVRPQAAFQTASAAGFQNTSPAKKNFSIKAKASGVRPKVLTTATAPQLWVKEGRWTPNNNWVVAYASLTGDSSTDQKAINMIVGGAASPTDDGGVLGTLDAYGLNGNLSPGNSAQSGSVFTLQDASSRTSLLSYLADGRYENFYYFGHGNDSAISAYNASQTAITGDQLSFALGNVPLRDSILHAALHPYRFVWIDACKTGLGSFCESFGIPAITVSTNFFATAGVESRAFIGFKKETSFDPSNSSADPNGWQNRSVMINQFLDAWLSGNFDLNTIVRMPKIVLEISATRWTLRSSFTEPMI